MTESRANMHAPSGPQTLDSDTMCTAKQTLRTHLRDKTAHSQAVAPGPAAVSAWLPIGVTKDS